MEHLLKTQVGRVYNTGMCMIRIWILFLTLSNGASAVPVREVSAPSASEARKTIYLVNHGLCLPKTSYMLNPLTFLLMML